MHSRIKLICAFLTLALAMMTFVCPVFAVSGSNQMSIESEISSNASFSMREADGVVVYTVKRGEVSDISEIISHNFFETKRELSMIGMEDDEIDGLTYAELVKYATSDSIIASVSYIKTAADGKQEHISEEQAIRESKAVNSGDTEKQNQKSDEYMRIWHCVTHLGDGLMFFQSSARWLTMPRYRGVDSLGSCASYFNSKANYSHSYIYIGATPSINFTDDDHTIGLDFSIVGAKEDRNTFLEFHYVP